MSLADMYQDKTLLADALDVLGNYVSRVLAAFGRDAQKQEAFSIADAPIDVLLQIVDLNVTNLASARRAVSLLLPRLSPLDPELIEWDLLGSNERIGERTRFILALVRRADLENWGSNNSGIGDLSIEADDGGEFSFRSSHTRESKRKTTLQWGLAALGLYAALWFALSSWADRPARISENWLAQARDARLAINANRNNAEVTNSDITIIQSYQSGVSGAQNLSILAELSKTLSNDAWIQEYDGQSSQIRLSGYSKDSAQLAAKIETNEFVDRVELGAVNADRASGLNRFTLTLILQPVKTGSRNE